MPPRDKIYSQLAQVALSDFADIVEDTRIIEGKLRILLNDESFVDIWLSAKKDGVYAYHWKEEMLMGGYLDTTISLIKKLRGFRLIQNTFMMELRRM
ncbi:MAG: hypothetical protein HXY46_14830 [Syntrophaceae bacterium]|nr:hypothetical protein [Syntrophaceae bacterium]